MSQIKLQKLFWELCNQLNAVQAILYTSDDGFPESNRIYKFTVGFAYSGNEEKLPAYHYGEGLIGQVAKSKATMFIDDIPEGYLKVISGLGTALPAHILIFPILKDDCVEIILEFAFFEKPNEHKLELLNAAKANLLTLL